MASPTPAPALPRRAGLLISVVGVAAYVLVSPLLFGDGLGGTLWWVAAGVVAVGVVVAGALTSANTARDHDAELDRLEDRIRDLERICETRRLTLENLVEAQLPALTTGGAVPPMPDPAGDEVTAAVITRAGAQLARVRDDRHARHDAVQAAVVTLGRKVQSSAHRIQEEAARMVHRHPADADVLHTSMRLDHAAAQQARNAQSLAALCGEWPGQQWHQALPLSDVVRGAAGRITAYQRVEVSGDPGVAVSARVVEPLIHVLAELLANAAQSSPPTTQVLVSLRHVQRGAVIEIDDGGVGLDDVRLERVRDIASGRRPVGLADLGEIPQTGLPVVGAYVRRHGFRVDITESVYGGLRAIVLVPTEMTEPVALSGVLTHALTRRPDPLPTREPITSGTLDPLDAPPGVDLVEFATPVLSSGESTTPEPPSPRPRSDPAPARDPRPDPEPEPEPYAGDLPALPRRRSRRTEALAGTVDWPGEQPEPPQSAEAAGQWMGAFLGATTTDMTHDLIRDITHDATQDTENR